MKIKINTFIQLVLLIVFSSTVFAQGHLLIIGGGKRPDRVMKKIIELSGGPDAPIVVIPMASGDPIDVGEYQVDQIKSLGSNKCSYINCDREEADSDSILARMDGVKGIFFSGGDQNKLAEALLGSKLLEKIKEIYIEGGVISGTSAGAAVMSKIMITGDELKYEDPRTAFATIEKENIKVNEGFGFLEDVIIDQHFIYRKRINRLFSAVLENPELLGIGIDESTAIIIDKKNVIEVVGDYQIIIVDPASVSKISSDSKGLLSAEGLNIHILLEGEKYNLDTRKVIE